eukprot:Hpha_TRINITY_DN16117_c2_g12::TRINITY_DN16117_c2_g12_i1::g.6899::m.6899
MCSKRCAIGCCCGCTTLAFIIVILVVMTSWAAVSRRTMENTVTLIASTFEQIQNETNHTKSARLLTLSLDRCEISGHYASQANASESTEMAELLRYHSMACGRVAFNLAFIHKALSNQTGEEEAHKEATRWDPGLVIPWLERAGKAEREGQNKDAVKLLEQGLKATSGEAARAHDAPRARIQSALARLLPPGDAKRRASLLRQFVDSDSVSAEDLVLFSELLRQEGDTKGAVKYAQKVVALDVHRVPAELQGRALSIVCSLGSEKSALSAAKRLKKLRAASVLTSCSTDLAERELLVVAEQVISYAIDIEPSAGRSTELAFLRIRRQRQDHTLDLDPAAKALQEAMSNSAPAPSAVEWEKTLSKPPPKGRARGRAPKIPGKGIGSLPRCPEMDRPPSKAEFEAVIASGHRPLLIRGAGKIKDGVDWSPEALAASASADRQVSVSFVETSGQAFPVVPVTSHLGGGRLTDVGKEIERLAKDGRQGHANEFMRRQGPGGFGLAEGAMAVVRPVQSQMYFGDAVRLASQQRRGVRLFLTGVDMRVYLPLLHDDTPLPDFAQAVSGQVAMKQLELGSGGVMNAMSFEHTHRLSVVVHGEEEVLMLPPSAYADLVYNPTLELDVEVGDGSPSALLKGYSAAAATVRSATWGYQRSSLNLTVSGEGPFVERLRSALQRGGACVTTARAGDALLTPAWWTRQVHESVDETSLHTAVSWMFLSNKQLDEARNDAYIGWDGWKSTGSKEDEDEDEDEEDEPKQSKRKRRR